MQFNRQHSLSPLTKSNNSNKLFSQWFDIIFISCKYQRKNWCPQSNRFVERAIQTIKKTLRKCREDHSDPCLAMSTLHTTKTALVHPPQSYWWKKRCEH